MKKIFTTALIILLFALSICAQQSKIDSLLNLEETAKEDHYAVLLYLKIGETYRDYGEIGLAKDYYRKAGKLSEKIDDDAGYYNYLIHYGDILKIESKYDSSLIAFQKALESANELNDKNEIARSLNNVGVAYSYLGAYENSQDYLYQALKSYEEMSDSVSMGAVYGALCANYAELYLWPQAYEAGEKAVHYSKGTRNYLYNLLNLGVCYFKGQPFQYEKAIAAFNEVLQLLEENPNIYVESFVQINLGNAYKNYNQFEKAEPHYLKAKELAEAIGNPEIKCGATLALGYLELVKDNLEKSEALTREALDIAQEYEMWEDEYHALQFLGDLSVFKRDFVNMRQYYNTADSIQQLITNDMIRASTEELAIKYETEKKDIQIAGLAKEKRLFLILMIAAIALIALILVIFLYRIRLNRKQKQLLTAQVALESETAERSRLAKDLHDGLGGMLSLIRINLSDMKGMKVIDQTDADRFGKALNMLDDSISELRRVAHHIMPESLVKTGLKTSLEDFAEAVPGAEFHFYGTEKRLDKNIEVVLYRSAHELVNNALKHASAKRINIQLVQESGRISLTVADDGIGFDVEQETKGSGLQNIKNRIAMYHGAMHIFSDSASGTEINIEIPLKE